MIHRLLGRLGSVVGLGLGIFVCCMPFIWSSKDPWLLFGGILVGGALVGGGGTLLGRTRPKLSALLYLIALSPFAGLLLLWGGSVNPPPGIVMLAFVAAVLFYFLAMLMAIGAKPDPVRK